MHAHYHNSGCCASLVVVIITTIISESCCVLVFSLKFRVYFTPELGQQSLQVLLDLLTVCHLRLSARAIPEVEGVCLTVMHHQLQLHLLLRVRRYLLH